MKTKEFNLNKKRWEYSTGQRPLREGVYFEKDVAKAVEELKKKRFTSKCGWDVVQWEDVREIFGSFSNHSQVSGFNARANGKNHPGTESPQKNRGDTPSRQRSSKVVSEEAKVSSLRNGDTADSPSEEEARKSERRRIIDIIDKTLNGTSDNSEFSVGWEHGLEKLKKEVEDLK